MTKSWALQGELALALPGPDLRPSLSPVLALIWFSLGSDWPSMALALAGLVIIGPDWLNPGWPFRAGPLPPLALVLVMIVACPLALALSNLVWLWMVPDSPDPDGVQDPDVAWLVLALTGTVAPGPDWPRLTLADFDWA